jgi:subtilisin-like proprotein convertase family protein
MRWPALLFALGAAACTFDRGGLPAAHLLRDDTAADFTADGATFDHTEVSAAGLITPAAFTTGALLTRGANSELFTDPKTADWASLDGRGNARIALGLPLGDWAGAGPIGVGITSNDKFTLWLEGEIWLEAGSHSFQMEADDVGFLDIAPTAGGAFTRVVTAKWDGGTGTGSFAAPADGWYAIHIAQSEDNGWAHLLVRHQPPGGAVAPLDADRLRVATGALRGLVTDAFDQPNMFSPASRTLLAAGALDQDFGSKAPDDAGLDKASTYSLHWAAQVRIDVAGDYAFATDTTDGHRVRVDGVLVLDHLVAGKQTYTSNPVHLDAGWHDLSIDYMRAGAASAYARLQVASGPELAGQPFPLDRVRPVVPRADRVAGASDDNSLAWAPGGTVTHTLTPPIPAGAVVVGLEVKYLITTAHSRDLQTTLITPDGTRLVMRAQGDTDHNGAVVEIRPTHKLDGKPASGSWKVEVADESGQNTGTTGSAALTVHNTGGRPPIATSATYVSPVHDLGEPSQIDGVSAGATTPDGTALAIRVRTGASQDELQARAWSDPVAPGAPPIVPAGRFVQYKVELSSDGDRSAALDWVQLVYR